MQRNLVYEYIFGCVLSESKDDLKEIYTYIPFYTVDTRSLTVTVIRIFYGGQDIANIAADFENL
mgnify:CR=1 FL=1